MFAFASEVVVITGVSGQLGYQYAAAFIDANARVAGIDLDESDSIKQLSESHPENFLYISCDITDAESIESALAEIKTRFGVPTVLINNAAIDSPPDAPIEETGPFEAYPDDSWDRVMNVNVKGTYLTCKIIGAEMAKQNYGSIINVSSIYGVVSPDQSIYEYRRKKGENFYKPVAYSVSKSAILNLTRYLAVYWARKNVRVNTIVIAGVFNSQDKDFLKAYCDRIPIGRMADKTEYNGAVMFLASRSSSYMTGAELVIDGGWTAI